MNDLTDAALRKMATEMCPFAIPLDDCPTCQRIYESYIALRDAARAEQIDAAIEVARHGIEHCAAQGRELTPRNVAEAIVIAIAAIRAQGGER